MASSSDSKRGRLKRSIPACLVPKVGMEDEIAGPLPGTSDARLTISEISKHRLGGPRSKTARSR
jgi:hypothetical protein